MFSLESFTLLLAIKHLNCFVGCDNGQIILGSVASMKFDENCCVIISIKDIVDFYCGLIKLFSLIAAGPYPSDKVSFLDYYSWQALNRNHVILGIKRNDTQRTIEFDYESFNSLIFCFSKVLFVSLGLREKEKILLHQIAAMSPDTIISLKDPQQCSIFCKDLNTDAFNLSVLVTHYLDIIIIYKKLLSVWDESFNKMNIERILTSNM